MELLDKTLHTEPKDGSTHWSVRSMEKETGQAENAVAVTLSGNGILKSRRKHTTPYTLVLTASIRSFSRAGSLLR